MISGIYKFTNNFSRKCYIGKSNNIEKRYKEHIRAIKRNDDSYFYRAVRKYGIENFKFEILHECEGKVQLNYWERFFIRMYCSNNHEWGYNCTSGGDGSFDIVWTEERRKQASIKQKEVQLKYWSTPEGKKMAKHHSEVMKGKKYSDESKLKRSIALKGHIVTQETREKLSKANLGRKHTDIARRHMSESHIGQIPVNKGKKLTEEERKRISILTKEAMKKLPKRKGIKGKHKVWDDDTHVKYHFE